MIKKKKELDRAIFGIKLGIMAIIVTLCIEAVSTALPNTPIPSLWIAIFYLILATLLLFRIISFPLINMKKINVKGLFLISWKKLLIIVIAWFVFVLLHNVIYALFNVEEPFFFILAVPVVPIYLLVMIIYSVIYKLRKKKIILKGM